MAYTDSFKHKGQRKILIEKLRKKGIVDELVLKAMGTVPRHLFMDPTLDHLAYEDSAYPIAAGQTISQPYTVAYQSSMLEIKGGEKVLEIGTGSGYQTAVLVEMGAKVFSVERQKELHVHAKHILPELHYQAKLFYGDGYKGLPTYAPFDRVIVTAGAPFIPEDLIAQLKPGGIMIIPVGEGKMQVMTRIEKDMDGGIRKKEFDTFSFVPLLENRT